MSKCADCFRYRMKEKEIAALKHEMRLMEEELKRFNDADACMFTARAVQVQMAQQQMTAQQQAYGRGVSILGGGGGGAGMQNAIGQQQANAMAQAIAQQGMGAAHGVSPLNPFAGANIYGGAGAGGSAGYAGAAGNGGAGGNGNMVTHAEAWCETHQRWGKDCNELRVTLGQRLARWGSMLKGCISV